MLDLKEPTSPRWLSVVCEDLDTFLVDHAACERKASATGMAFVVRYPDRAELIDEMIAFAREELEHFHEVYRIIVARGLTLAADVKDPYVQRLSSFVRNGREQRLLDRLVLAGVIEARGCERFGILARGLDPGELKDFYAGLLRSESRHAAMFHRLARKYFDETIVRGRIEALLDLEAEVVRSLAIRPTLH